MKKWELSRFAIFRRNDFFEIISPAGGLYQLDREMVERLLALHGQKPSRNLSEIEQFAVEEFLVTEKTGEIKAPFQIDRVQENLQRSDMRILTLCDLALLIARDCNYRCLGCSVGAKSAVIQNHQINWQEVVSDGASFGAINLALTGGEPILPRRIDFICQLVGFARSLGYRKVVIATNGSYLSRYLHQLQEAGVTRFSISYHGSDEYAASYTGNINAGKYSRAAIRAVLNAKVYLTINCVVTRGNFDQLDAIVGKLLPIIVDQPHAYLRFSPLVLVGDAKSAAKYQLTRKDYFYLLERIAGWKEQFGRLIRLTCDEECLADDPMLCDAGLVYAMVNEKGIVSACDLLEEILPIGNLADNGFFEIWNDSDRWRDYRNIVPINQRCLACGQANRNICFGRCKALSYLRHGSLFMDQNPQERRCWL